MRIEDDVVITQRIIQSPAWVERNFDANGSPCEEEAATPVYVIDILMTYPPKEQFNKNE
jgi:hypothetical protein